jgi:hypothetical protein
MQIKCYGKRMFLFSGNGPVPVIAYPGTIIGVMAKWRELYHNSSQDVTHLAAYNTNAMVSRPPYNQAHEALMPLVKKEETLYFKAQGVKDISRALAMQKDLGMKMVIGDAKEAWYLKNQFKTNGIPLILSLDLPEDKTEKKEEAKAKAKEEKAEGAEKEKAKDEAMTEVKDTIDKKSPIGDLMAKQDTIKKDPERKLLKNAEHKA